MIKASDMKPGVLHVTRSALLLHPGKGVVVHGTGMSQAMPGVFEWFQH